MSAINEEKMKQISAEIFEVSKMFPGKVQIKHMKEPISKEEIAVSFGHEFEEEFQVDNPAIIDKIKELVNRGYQDNVWVMFNPFDVKYELFSHR